MAQVIWWMHALGRDGLPPRLSAGGVDYALEKTVKHDFWAGTGFYRIVNGPDAGRLAVAKINRRLPAFGILPLRWIGRWLKHREVRAYTTLQDLPNIPKLLGDATDTGFLHAFAEGEPLKKGAAVPDAFFDELMALIHELNRRGIAYVDTNKPENIILGTDGRPHLIDFQISFDANAWWPRALGRQLLKPFYRSDVYHVLKQKRRFRPDQLTADELTRLEQRSLAVRVHRALTKPYFLVRRPIMRWLERSGRVGETGSN
jgi:hypothetical protein